MNAHMVERFDKVLSEWDVVSQAGVVAHFHSRSAAQHFLDGWNAANLHSMPVPERV